MTSMNVTADELRQFIERAEQLAAEKDDISEQEKELFAEAKGRGYDTRSCAKSSLCASGSRMTLPKKRRCLNCIAKPWACDDPLRQSLRSRAAGAKSAETGEGHRNWTRAYGPCRSPALRLLRLLACRSASLHFRQVQPAQGPRRSDHPAMLPAPSRPGRHPRQQGRLGSHLRPRHRFPAHRRGHARKPV